MHQHEIEEFLEKFWQTNWHSFRQLETYAALLSQNPSLSFAERPFMEDD